MMVNNSYYGSFRQLKFADVWTKAEDFVTAYKNSGLAPTNNKITDDSATALFYLLYAKYGGSTVASSDINQFKYQVFNLIFSYGPAWERRVDVQNKLRALTDDEIFAGATTIFNHALNPANAPTTGTTVELEYINEQTVNKQVRNKLAGYEHLLMLLDADVTEEFLKKFSKLFLTIVQPELPLYYVTTLEEEETEDM